MDERKALILETAADWADRLDELTARERDELQVWLAASADHASAFARMTRMMADTALVCAMEDGAEASVLPATRRAPARRPGLQPDTGC